MKESNLERRLLNKLNNLDGCRARSTLGGHTEYGTPDIFGCFRGKTLVIEVKTEDGKVSKLQRHRLKQWRDAGAFTAVFRPSDTVSKLVEAIRCTG